MRIEERFETIKEFTCLSPQDKELVTEEYWRAEHPYQIEYQIWVIIIPLILFGAAEFVFKDKLELSNFELFGLSLIMFMIFYFISRLIFFKLIEPKVLRKIICNRHKLKKASNKRRYTDAR